jgi:hypothetical protein
MSKVINVFDLAQANAGSKTLERLRIGETEIAFVPFSKETLSVDLHYCKESQISDYVQCNGDGCVLCRIGKSKTNRYLMPVYDPISKRIGILPVGDSFRPYALLPQLIPILGMEKPQVVFVSRSADHKHKVTSVDLGPDTDSGEKIIQQYLENYRLEDIATVFPTHDNLTLAAVPEIAALLQLKECRTDAADHNRN